MSRRWSEIDGVFDRALDVPHEERESFLAGACGDDHDLEDRVRRLLAAVDEPDHLLEIGTALRGALWAAAIRHGTPSPPEDN